MSDVRILSLNFSRNSMMKEKRRNNKKLNKSFNPSIMMVYLLKTPSFELAVYVQGDSNAEKLALLLPGRIDTKDYPHMKSHVDYLASKGYLALSFDPPGTWESPGGIKSYTMTNYLKAVNELIEHFGNRPTALIGHSRGGSIAMLVGTSNVYVTHIITTMSRPQPSKIIERDTQNGAEISYQDTPSGGRIKFELPLSYFIDASQYDAVDALSRCTKPKLFISGKKDDDITPESVRETYHNSAEPKELYEVDSEHNYRFHPKIVEEINQCIGKFLDRKF